MDSWSFYIFLWSSFFKEFVVAKTLEKKSYTIFSVKNAKKEKYKNNARLIRSK